MSAPVLLLAVGVLLAPVLPLASLHAGTSRGDAGALQLAARVQHPEEQCGVLYT